MGFYECIYDCGEDNYCVDCGSSLDNFSGSWWLSVCKKHELKVGGKFKYNLYEFIKKFTKTGESIQKNVYDVEILEIANVEVKCGRMTIVRMKTDLDCSKMNESKKIFYSMLDDAPSWKKTKGGYIITLPFSNNAVIRNIYTGNRVYWNWEKNKIEFRGTSDGSKTMSEEAEIKRMTQEAEIERMTQDAEN